jgi:hypothetical protein
MANWTKAKEATSAMIMFFKQGFEESFMAM